MNLNLHLMTKKDMINFFERLTSEISSVENRQLKIVLLAFFNKMSTECRDIIIKQQETDLQTQVANVE
jgi:hypothetical protein